VRTSLGVLLALLLSTDAARMSGQSFAASYAAKDDSAKNDPDYQRGLTALDARNWDDAIERFREYTSHGGANADAALYWLAYAQSHAGERENALTTLRQLERTHASSKWVNDAKALEVEIQAKDGKPVSPAAEQDEELKLLALNALMTSDPDKAFPVLQRLLNGNGSDRLKEKALFVLVQNPSPQAKKLLSSMARGASTPELQLKAIRYMGMLGAPETSSELQSLYSSSHDDRVKREILKSFLISGSRAQLLAVAKSESNPELQREAIRALATSGGKDELWQLFQQDSSVESKKEILKSIALSGDSTRLAEAAQSTKNAELKVAAIKALGLMGSNGRPDVLLSLYRTNSDPEVRRAVIQAFFLQQNGKALVDLARAEKDPQMKQQIVKQMALVHSKEVTDYMMEVLR
jgi:hypothetical protein